MNKTEGLKSKQFIERFGNIEPSRDFTNQLEERLLTLNPSHNVGIRTNFSIYPLMRKALLIGIPVMSLLLLIGGVAFYQNSFWARSRIELLSIKISPSRQAEVLQNASGAGLFNNLRAYLPFSNAEAHFRNNGLDTAADTSMIAPEWMMEKSYSYSKQTYRSGPKADRCQGASIQPYSSYMPMPEMVPGYKGEITTEGYSFYDPESAKAISYNKSITKAEDGQIIYYNLSNEDGSYTYYGGKYGLFQDQPAYTMYDDLTQLTEEDPVGADTDGVEVPETTMRSLDESELEPTPRSLPNTPDSTIGKEPESITDLPPVSESPPYSGKVVDIVMLDGVEAYVTEERHSVNCGDGEFTIVLRSWVSKGEFSIIKSEEYYNSVKGENLISSSSYKFSISAPDFSEVEGNFVLDIDVPLKTIKYPEPDADPTNEKAKAELYRRLQQEDLQLLLAKSIQPVESRNEADNAMAQLLAIDEKSIALESLYVYTEEERFNPMDEALSDRAFYAPGKTGEAMHQGYIKLKNQYFVNTLANYSYRINREEPFASPHVNVTIYEKGQSIAKIKGAQYPYYEFKKGTLTIDESILEAEVYIGSNASYTDPMGARSSNSRDMADSSVDIYTNYNRTYIFSYSGRIYEVTISSDTDFADIHLTTKSSTGDFDYIKSLVEKSSMYLGDQVMPMGSDGGSDPTGATQPKY